MLLQAHLQKIKTWFIILSRKKKFKIHEVYSKGTYLIYSFQHFPPSNTYTALAHFIKPFVRISLEKFFVATNYTKTRKARIIFFMAAYIPKRILF